MKTRQIPALATTIMDLIPEGARAGRTHEQVMGRLYELLFAERQLALAHAEGLISAREAADAVTAHLETWLCQAGNPPLPYVDWSREDVAVAIVNALSVR